MGRSPAWARRRSSRTPATLARVSAYLNDPAVEAALGENALWLEDALDRLPPGESSAARAALDMALHDLWGQHLGQPLFRLWGLNPARSPRSSFTIAMDDDEAAYRARLRAAAQHGLIKLKLGSGGWRDDLERARIARDEVAVPLCVDANGGWSAEDGLAIIPRLAGLGVIFVEQPVARDDQDGWRALRDGLPGERPPLIADESVQGVDSVPPLAGLADGINIKLAARRLRAARQMTRWRGLRVARPARLHGRKLGGGHRGGALAPGRLRRPGRQPADHE